ncbi:MAG: redoxin family protein [Planctomycetes bacterium]|nr:redoxin family protein [Planctomycetota bacterium]
MLRVTLGAILVLIGAIGTTAADEPAKEKDAKKSEAQIKGYEQLSLKDLDGKVVTAKDLKGKIVVFEWIEPMCPTCQRHAKEGSINHLVAKYKDKKDVVILGVCTSRNTDVEGMKAFAKERDLKYRILMDPTGAVGRMFGAQKTPHMYVVKDGAKLYEGALDDDARGSKSEKERVNYISKALDEILAGKKVSTPSTKPYG